MPYQNRHTHPRFGEVFRSALINIYRHWYLLPPKSARRHLDRARKDLARRLQQTEPQAATQLMLDFLKTITALNGVRQVGGRALAQALEQTANPPQGNDTHQDLIDLLSVPDPAVYALSLLEYRRRDLLETFTQLLARINIGREKLPTDLQEEIDAATATVLERWDEIGSGLLTTDKSEIVQQALQALEQIPAVVRIASDILLDGKSEDGRSTRTVTSLGAKGLQPPPAPRTPSSLPQQNESLESSKRGTDGPLFTDVRFPAHVAKQRTEPLIVQLTIEPPSTESRAQGAVTSVLFDNPAQPEYIDVILNAPGFAERTGIWARTIQVYSDQDSQPAIFLLQAVEEGEQLLTIEFRHNHRHINSVAFRTTISGMAYRSATASSTTVDFVHDKPFGPKDAEDDSGADATLSLSQLSASPPPPADLELRVLKDKRENRLHFLLHSTNAKVGYHWRNMGSIELTSKNPQSFFEEKFKRLSTLAFHSAEPGSEAATSLAQEIEQMGEELFEELFPAALRTEYWQRIKPLSQAGTIRTLLITSDEPWIPWELIKPYQQDEYSGDEEQDEFLSLSFQMCRWLAGRTPTDIIDIAAATIIAPDVNLPNAEREVAYLQKLGERGVLDIGPRLETLTQVKQFARQGESQLLHVATHGKFDSENPDQSMLLLADNEALLLSDFAGSGGSGLRRSRPLVFLNACHSGRSGQGLTLSGMGGWAGRMITKLNVSAFIGSLWEVNDALAADFAIAFYDALINGKTLAQAFHQARKTVRDLQPGNSTWLAYTLYGDPNGRVTFAEPDRTEAG